MYDFTSTPENLRLWTSGFGAPLQELYGAWVAAGPVGPVKVRFAARNDFGVLDHYVVLAEGAEIYSAANRRQRTGSEIIFTLFHLAGTSAEKFAADVEEVERDLAKLKALLEAE